MIAAIIVAAGSSRRMRDDVPKQWQLLNGMPLLRHSFQCFDRHPEIGQIVVALDPPSLEIPDRLDLLRSEYDTAIALCAGGPARQESVWNALRQVEQAAEMVLIHDAARPFIRPQDIEACIEAIRLRGGAILARPVVDTIKKADASGKIVATIDRENLWAAQTPQGFLFEPLLAAYRANRERLEQFTDDAAIFEANGGAVYIVPGSEGNFKITTREDWERAERFLQRSSHAAMQED